MIQRLWAHPPKITTPAQPDPALQTSRGPLISVTPGLNFDGIDEAAQQGASGLLAIPPDTNGAVGATQFVQWVNYAFAVFDKTSGEMVYGPAAGKTLWKGFGGPCETNNSGDPIAQYDKTAGRWVLTQPVFTNPFAICFAVSTTSEYTGQFHRYAFSMPAFPDYPKLGIWPDAYYMSIDLYTQGQGYGGKFKGPYLCAFDRSLMLKGDKNASMQCWPPSNSLNPDYAHLLPSDLDGNMPPPEGSPNYFLSFFGTNSLKLWKFHVDFNDSQKTQVTGPTNIQVDDFTEACGGGICIPQAGTKELLDSLGDRLMYRLAYRNFRDHESLVVNHSVTAVPTGSTVSTVGVRWYEIRDPNGVPTVFQKGTFAPDANFRWMGSVAMDKVGDMAIGYSVSSSGMYPSIRFTGRLAGDKLGTLQAEQTILPGGGSQLKLDNWGDYSSMSIDPVDDCTFWYTTEYLPKSGKYNWSTRIRSFKFSSCH
ncbi:hypothetical protein [Methylocapsa aurea]|uniref:hypothetical protein n=1 Tax=Methylocapsa aurea TaxID=663610 RepID=UPI00138E52E6|nr:hypothetical protein [Methylocapsa aurea]